MNNLDKQYTDLLQDILINGVVKSDRTGTGTISIFGRQIRHKMSDGFPLLTTKKMPFKTIVTELLWFLRGDTNIKYLVDNGCHIWNGDAYKRYLNTYKGNFELDKEEFINAIKTSPDFAEQWGNLGSIYGKQWRRWTYLTREKKEDIDRIDESICGVDMFDSYRYYRTFDQITNLINDLKTNPDSRRLMVSAWNVGELDQMVLPPCHYGFQVYTRELSVRERLVYWHDNSGNDIFPEGNIDSNNLDKLNVPKRAISLMWNQRSVDTFLGLPFNIASYGLLLEIIAKAVNMVPDELIGNLGDVHLYSNHVEQAKEQIGRELTVEERVKLYEVKTNADTSFFPILSETLDFHNIPKRTREPYPLPTLKINSGNENWHLLTIDEIINSLDVDITFKVDGYQSHPAIKAPLSN